MTPPFSKFVLELPLYHVIYVLPLLDDHLSIAVLTELDIESLIRGSTVPHLKDTPATTPKIPGSFYVLSSPFSTSLSFPLYTQVLVLNQHLPPVPLLDNSMPTLSRVSITKYGIQDASTIPLAAVVGRLLG